jgi:hypothetical protein
MYANPLSLLQVKASIIRQKLKGRPTFDLVALTAHATGSRQRMQVSYDSFAPTRKLRPTMAIEADAEIERDFSC